MIHRSDVNGILSIPFYCFLLLLIGWVDYVTGPLLAFSPFYLIVLVFIALHNPWKVAMIYAFLASVVFLTAEVLTNPDLSHTIYPYWRALGQMFSFGLVTFMIPKLVEESQELTRSEKLLREQGAELQELNGKLIMTLEELSAVKERTVEELLRHHIELLRQHTVAVGELKGTLEQDSGLSKNLHEVRVLLEKVDEFLADYPPKNRLSH